MPADISTLLVNTYDLGGGAEKVAMDLHLSYLKLGVNSHMLVGKKISDLSSVYEIPRSTWYKFWCSIEERIIRSNIRGIYRLHKIVKNIRDPFFEHARKTGKENYQYPESRNIIRKLLGQIDVFHLHNLHTEYFDLTLIADLSKKKPILVTLHDEYLFTGHCAITLGCERWKIGCGDCPHLDTYPAVKRDNTRHNWNKKRSIFSKSQLALVTPSKWLAQRVNESFLSQLPVIIIPNGVDTSVFKPAAKDAARNVLGIEQKSFVILYAASGGRNNPFKDYAMLDRVIAHMQARTSHKDVIILALGGDRYREESVNHVRMIEKPFVKKPEEVARHYQACDLYVHPSKADNAPLAILEAMACGKPVVATSVGGIPELVREDETGYIVNTGNDEMMTERIAALMDNPEKLEKFGLRAAQIAQMEYSLVTMVSNYLNLYEELIREMNDGGRVTKAS